MRYYSELKRTYHNGTGANSWYADVPVDDHHSVRIAAKCWGARRLALRLDDVAILKVEHIDCSEPDCPGYHYEKLNDRGEPCGYALKLEHFPEGDYSDSDGMASRVRLALERRAKEFRVSNKRARKARQADAFNTQAKLL